jgi:ubiquinone/menaquinone biosynthesis C-methylase UbiE
MTKDFWNKRYSEPDFVYGEEANIFLKTELEKLPIGRILFPADGEGRNSVFAATKEWEVSAFDISEEGKKKAIQLTEKNKVKIEYQVGELNDLDYKPKQFDAVALIYAHFPGKIKSSCHKEIDKLLKKDGTIIFEAFSKKHLEYNSKNPEVGGPKDPDTLFSIKEIKSDFSNYEIIELSEKEVELNEGKFHIGLGSVIRFVGRKK